MELVATVEGVPVYLRPRRCDRDIRCVCKRRRPPARLVQLPEEHDEVGVRNNYAMVSIISSDPGDAIRRLVAAGYKLSPYSINGCVIVTAGCLDEALRAVREVADTAREAYVLSMVWDARLPVKPPLLKLHRYGFLPSAPARVTGYVDASVAVTVFQTGLVRVTGPVLRGEASLIAGRVVRLARMVTELEAQGT